ncbi:heterokaryon incompatibility protein-domain-containing protein, partial [Phaeosphaeriaceae sp. PMI808]
KDEIRVVGLRPALHWDDQIECSLTTLSLSDPDRPQYQALSYVWGDSRVTLPIKVNGFHFEGTKNLVDALHALRLQDKERLIWIDAICINQGDIQERNQQVKKMADIYRKSSATVAWLGPSTEKSEQRPPESFRSFRVMSSKYFHIVREFNQPGWNLDNYRVICQELPTVLRCLEATCNVPWWYRIWTAQETILPRKLFFMSGPYTVSYRVFDQASK